MADIYSTTPGSAVADTIQQILQRRREDARRAMLDKLEREQLDMRQRESVANIEAQQARTKHDEDSLGLQRTQENRLANELLENQMHRRLQYTRPLTPMSQMDPKLAEYARKYGATTQTPDVTPTNTVPFRADGLEGRELQEGADLTTEFDPTVKGQEVYAGSPEFAYNELINQRAGGLMQDPNFQNLSPVGKFLALRSAGLDNVPEWAAAGPRRVVPIHPGQRTPVELRPDDIPMEFGYPPQTPYWMGSTQIYQVYKDGRWVKSLSNPSPEESRKLAAEGYELREGNTSSQNSRRSGPAATIITKMANAKAIANALRQQREDKAWGSWKSAPSPAELKAQEEYDTLSNYLFANDPAPQAIKEIAAEVMSNPNTEGLSPQQIVSQVEGEDGQPLSPEEAQHLLRLLSQ